jgi:hypothetical protein
VIVICYTVPIVVNDHGRAARFYDAVTIAAAVADYVDKTKHHNNQCL